MCRDAQGSGCWVRLLVLLQLPQRKFHGEDSPDGLWPGLTGEEAGALSQTEGLTSMCLSIALLQETAMLLHLVETCPSFTPLLRCSYETNGIFLAAVQSASFGVGSEPNAVFAPRHCNHRAAV